MNDLYALEKLSEAVYALATGAGDIRSRLLEAGIILVRVRPEDIPDKKLRRTLVGIKDDLAFEQAKGDEGRIAATLAITSDEDGSAIAKRILGLYHSLSDLTSRNDE